MLFHAFLLALSALAPFTLAQTTAAQGQDCVQGVLVVAARGSDPNWHDATKTDPDYAQLGELRNIANGVVNEVKMGSRVRAVPYPATTDDYPTSVSHGVAAVKGIIRDYVDGCSKKVDPKIVLLGYSQGAQVMSDVLVGGGGGNALEAKYTKRSKWPIDFKIAYLLTRVSKSLQAHCSPILATSTVLLLTPATLQRVVRRQRLTLSKSKLSTRTKRFSAITARPAMPFAPLGQDLTISQFTYRRLRPTRTRRLLSSALCSNEVLKVLNVEVS